MTPEPRGLEPLPNGPGNPREPQLARGLGLTEATSLVVGGIIGTSIFLVPARTAHEVGAPGVALLVWVISGILATCGALSFAELGAALPQTGGTYVFLKRAYRSRALAFFFGWTMFFGTATGAVAVVATMVALYAGHFLGEWIPYGAWTTRAFAVLIIMMMTFINYLGVKLSGQTQNILTSLKILILLVIVMLCFFSGQGDAERFSPFAPVDRGALDLLAALGTAMILSLFSFNGWYFSAHVAGEIRDPRRNVPRSMLIGLAIVFAVYVLINFAYLYVLPFGQLRASDRVAADAMKAVLGPFGASLTALAVMVSAIGTLNAQLLNYPRIVFALAGDGLFFKFVSRVHPVRRTPASAILILGFWASGFALAGTYQEILTYVGFVSHLFLTLAVGAVIVLRFREPDLDRPYRTWGYPVTPMLFLAISGWYLVNLLINRLAPTMVGIGIMLVGLPFFLYWSRKR